MKITIYSLPDCVQCDQTKKLFDRNKVAYNVVDVSTDADSLKMIQDLGYSSAPVVIADEKHWSGFRIEKIKDIVAELKAAKTPEAIIASQIHEPNPQEVSQKIIAKLKDEGYEIKKNENINQ
jgi:glutaredoxin-like protein NrdH